jgi:Protein of unknown function (DUF1501)
VEHPFESPLPASICRRAFLGRSATGLGSLALASLLDPTLLRAGDARRNDTSSRLPTRWTGTVSPLHFPPRIKRVIYLYMAGGPSHLETLDFKPTLARMSGQPMPESITRGQPIAQLQGAKLVCLAPQHRFQRCGSSGQELSTVFPHLATVADEICVIRSMVTEAINHDPAHTFMNTGTTISGRPALGSWLNYGLGSESDELPGFVVLTSDGHFGQAQPIASRQWHSGFLPSRFQGVRFYSKGDPVLYMGNPPGIDEKRQRDVVDAVRTLDSIEEAVVDDPEIATRIAAYETAFRMQTSVPGLIDLSNEPKSALDLYGVERVDGSFGANCLLARRLAERGVRFIQLYHRDWDHHGVIKQHVQGTAAEVDQGSAALIKDLKQRGMLDDTLVIWGGEFGRTPMAQGDGRDHHIKGFSIWLAGGGIKRGISHGSTDEFGYAAVENVVHVHDLHATILALFGIDHLRLVYRFQGRDFRLTDVAGHVVKPILA